MSARPLSPRLPRTRRSRAALATPVLAVTLALAPALTVLAPAAGAEPGRAETFPAPTGPSQMPFDGQGSDDSRDGRTGDELSRKAEDLGGSVVNEVIDLATGVIKCGINLATDSVPCPL
ncbi:hypothetical protein [Nocardia higoensis]|uniref:hypothetical protein n=1 Tax=Nocardia higoensis TaxID=228599 RepID=UPI0002D8CCDD|nr:hypothetical protein [Nocardia higoensis]